MKLKYYLRGLGIGMLVAALVLALSGNSRAKMSDEAVKRRAAELGMVERDKTVLEDIGGTTAEDAESGTQPEDGAANQPQEEEPADSAAEPEKETEPEDGGGETQKKPEADEDTAAKTEEEDHAGEQVKTPETGKPAEEQKAVQEIVERADEIADRAEEIAENAPAGRVLTLEVRRGDSSVAVARRAAEAGLVRSAADFDLFLCQNGYDKRISVGSYEITEGMTEKEIADIITKSR